MTNTNRKFKIVPPIGTIVVPKETLNEAELREFALQINNNEENRDVWVEKIEKDEIDSIVDWFRGAGFTITEDES